MDHDRPISSEKTLTPFSIGVLTAASAAIVPVFWRVLQMKYLLPIPQAILLCALIPGSVFAAHHVYVRLVAAYWDVDKRYLSLVDALSYLAFLLLLCAFLPFDFPQKWNHFLGKFRTAGSLALLVFIQAKAWTFITLVSKHGLKRPFVSSFLFFLCLFGLSAPVFLDDFIGGDEIGYYTMMRSISEDHDIDIGNNLYPRFATMHNYLNADLSTDMADSLNRERYMSAFFHNGPVVMDANGTHRYFPSMPLVPLLWAAPYSLGREPAVAVFRCIVSALAFTLLFLICLHFSIKPALALALLFITSLSFDIQFFTHSYWTEMTAVLILAGAVYLLLQDKFSLQLLSAVLFALLPWAHFRLLVLPGIASVVVLCSRTLPWRRKAALLGCIIAVAGPVFAFNHFVFDSLTPWRIANNIPAISVIKIKEIIWTLIGRDQGFVLTHPLIVPALAGLVLLPAWMATIIAGYLLYIFILPVTDMTFFSARYFLPIWPLLIAGLALGMRRSRDITGAPLFLGLSIVFSAWRFIYPQAGLHSIAVPIFSVGNTTGFSWSDCPAICIWTAIGAWCLFRVYKNRSSKQ